LLYQDRVGLSVGSGLPAEGRRSRGTRQRSLERFPAVTITTGRDDEVTNFSSNMVLIDLMFCLTVNKKGPRKLPEAFYSNVHQLTVIEFPAV
jgi:hypothetical protein